jgi:hypothetical protein
MSSKIYLDIARSEGYCCPMAFTVASYHISPKKLEARLGIARRTIDLWRERTYLGKIGCEGNRNCCKNDIPPYSLSGAKASPTSR